MKYMIHFNKTVKCAFNVPAGCYLENGAELPSSYDCLPTALLTAQMPWTLVLPLQSSQSLSCLTRLDSSQLPLGI